MSVRRSKGETTGLRRRAAKLNRFNGLSRAAGLGMDSA
jgi:hypothetical protein